MLDGEKEHGTGTDLPGLGSLPRSLVVVLEDTAELKSDPTSHHTHAVDGVDEGFGLLLQDVAVGQLDHGSLLPDPSHRSIIPLGSDLNIFSPDASRGRGSGGGGGPGLMRIKLHPGWHPGLSRCRPYGPEYTPASPPEISAANHDVA